MVLVTVNEGLLDGELVENEYGGTFYSFKGVPYAEPPVGDLRFKAPKPPKPWDGVRSANKFGSISCQAGKKGVIHGSEDCLYLNVYTPELTPKELLPVIFWIPGGSFVQGSGNDDLYGPEFLLRKGVILVTCNYRLGVLGFLSLQSEDIPGNAGMKDQVAALRWVNKNISNFGGDPNNITLSGQSCGAASVGYHLVSPMTKGLFKRVIAHSGTTFAIWALTFQPRERAKALARKLGCNSDDEEILYNFLKSQPVDVLETKIPITLVEDSIARISMSFSVVSEEKFEGVEWFFSGDMLDTETNKIHDNIEILTGYNEHDGLTEIVTPKFDLDKVLYQANNLLDFLIPKHAAEQCPLTEQVEIRQKIKEYYFHDELVTTSNFIQLINFFSFDWFIYGQLQFARMCARANMIVYLSKFICKSERNVFLNYTGVRSVLSTIPVTAHADDLTYIFPVKALCRNKIIHTETYKMIETVTTLWTNFAKYGNPTPDDSLGVRWPSYDLEKQEYLEIGKVLVPRTAPENEELKLWDDIYKKYMPQLYVAST